MAHLEDDRGRSAHGVEHHARKLLREQAWLRSDTLLPAVVVVATLLIWEALARAGWIPALSLVLSTLVLVIFSLYLLYDLNRIIRGGETNYVLATTGVYISLLNIFSSLLHLLMAFGGEKD